MTIEAVREVLRLWQAGASLRAIARATNLDRKTVRRYVTVVGAMRLERWMAIDDDAVRGILRAVRRPEIRVTDTQQRLEAQRERIRLGLALRVSLAHIHAALTQEGVQVSYATLRRFAIVELGWRVRRTRALAA